MTTTPAIEPVTGATLTDRAAALTRDGWRFAQACATTLPDGIELTYSFARAADLQHLRLTLPRQEAPPVPSLSAICAPAFLYENEMHDLFGVTFSGLTVDYGSQFYRTAQPFSFAPQAEPQS
ncbi:MAG TPA: NADH-quinone oxidoreductase subunit C [bacterium]|nr:NADH-quinone oxidoreductase subunit C [bacterium]